MPAIVRRVAALIDAERPVALSLRLRESQTTHLSGAKECLRLEFTSRGDRVQAQLWLPADGNSKAPLVALQSGMGDSIAAERADAIGALLEAGFAVTTLDWPLQGRRSSVKLSARLMRALDSADTDPNGDNLVEQFTLQAALDLARTLDAIALLEPVDTGRVALVGTGLGAHLIALLAASDPRPAALALAPTSPGAHTASPILGSLLAAGPARPVLLLAAKRAPAIEASALEALRVACPGTGQIGWTEGPTEPIAQDAARLVTQFVAQALAPQP